jgi:hypothetical protein
MFKQFGETQTTCASLDIFLLRRNTRLASIKLIERISTTLDVLLKVDRAESRDTERTREAQS